jgi:hypothetical protein
MRAKNLLICFFVWVAVFSGCKQDDQSPIKLTFNGDTVSGVWEKNGTYTIAGHLYIAKGTSLTIEEGATIIMSDTTVHTEIIVSGNLYCTGTSSNPVKFTVPESMRTTDNALKGLWGGILADSSSQEILLSHTIIEYAGAITTVSSPSVLLSLYKDAAGERLPVLWTSNTSANVVVTNSVIRNIAEDCFYLEGGNIIIENNTFHTSGNSGGEAINVKSGCIVDACYNLIYSPNTNGFKLSNSGDRSPQAQVYAYNNTIINAGWRRPSVKGGSIWLETSVIAKVYNNLIANCRFGIKNSKADAQSVWDYTYYYGYDQTCVDQFQSTESSVVSGNNDITGTVAGENDPLFVNYPLSTDMYSSTFDDSWDFHLESGSPAIGKGTTAFTPNFVSSGISVNGTTYTSPAPSSTIGAFGTE